MSEEDSFWEDVIESSLIVCPMCCDSGEICPNCHDTGVVES